ncbi:MULTISPECIES: methyltransferase [unclassified Micromonospora]|uniref:methyltransferase n=1 Tax=unclassified Micromonospora TaxID=2617518 RepID=UPI0010342478|nr:MULTISPECIES: methyltransferase [unclassified Micromonospora]QKW14249.1 ArsR family transcriptional regulator [Verrucosispora sp. NA02020]TBL35930.1 ArsR family transcriptional regulator [Verrucosispora sp. SN26_14.1]
MTVTLSPRALMSLLANGPKAMDVLETALALGLLDELEPGPVRLDTLADDLKVRPLRLYKFLDCLESLGFLVREGSGGDIGATRYRAVPGLRAAVEAVVGPDALERDRDRYPWRLLHGRLADSLRGEVSIDDDDFAWPPKTDEQTADFERSMAVGLGPVVEAVRQHAGRLWPGRRRLLDVGGGDGTLAAHVLDTAPELRADVYNLPAVAPLVDHTRVARGHPDRLGFVGGDFLTEELPPGYDAMSFVRVLHDWPDEVARHLVTQAYAALEPGGLLLICEEFRTPDRLAMQFFWSYFLIGVDTCVSRLREAGYYTTLLVDTGFTEVTVLPGTWELVTARKPTSRG